MGFSILQSIKTNTHAWLSFVFGVMICVFALSYAEVRKEPPGLLVFDATSTKPGTLKVLYAKDGKLTDPGWVVNFSKNNPSHLASFPLGAGLYDLVGFKPLVEAGGTVSISNLKIISGAGIRNISEGNFVVINQLEKVSSQNGVLVIAPAHGANDPFGVFSSLQEVVPKTPFALASLLWVASGKFALIAVILILMYGLSGSVPFARGERNGPMSEPGLSQWLGFLAIGLIVLYLRNVHSIVSPVLYAEDGTWTIGLVDLGFFDMLFNAREDYFVFGNVLLMALAKLCNDVFFGHNLSYLPHFVSFISMLFYAALAVAPILLLRDVLRIEARLLLWLCVLLVPLGNSSYEVLGRLNNIGYVFLFLAFCLLIWRRYSLQEGSRKQIVATDTMLFLCANTNPLCYPLIGIAFGIEAWQHWDCNGRPGMGAWLKKYLTTSKARSALALLAMLFLMGLWLVVREMGAISPMAGKIVISNVPEIIVARTILYPIIFPFYTHFNNLASGSLLLIAVVSLSLLAKGVQRERFVMTSAAVVLVSSAIITVASRPALTEILDQYKTSFPDRYFFGLNLFVYLVLASALSAGFGADKKWRRVVANMVAGGLIALYAGNRSFMFEFSQPRFDYLPKATFIDEVRKSYQAGGYVGPNGLRYKVALHPAPAVAYLPEDYVVATVLGVRSLPYAMTDQQSKGRPIMKVPAAIHRYEGKVVRQKPAGRGREDGWFYVSEGMRSWIPDGNWLKQKNLTPADVIEITSEDFDAIPDSGVAVKPTFGS